MLAPSYFPTSHVCPAERNSSPLRQTHNKPRVFPSCNSLSNPLVNSNKDRRSECAIWCRSPEFGSHFSFPTCTHASSTCEDTLSARAKNKSGQPAGGTSDFQAHEKMQVSQFLFCTHLLVKSLILFLRNLQQLSTIK